MPILRDFERRLGGLVEGFFATTFRSGLQPVELAKRIQREMDGNRTVGVREVWAPNRFVITLSPTDGDRFEQAEQALVSELRRVVRETARERGWGLVGAPEIDLVVDDGLSKGRFDVEASFVEGTAEPAPEAGGGSLVVHERGGGSRTITLDRAVMTIGRLPESDIVLDDPGASRQHARIHAAEGEYVLSDLGSTNGTFVNDEQVRERMLEDGDRVSIGETVLEFRRS